MSNSTSSSIRTLVIGLLFAGALALVLFFLFSANSRVLHVVNHTPNSMVVKLADGATHELEPNTWTEAEIKVELQSLALFQGTDSVGSVEFDPTAYHRGDEGVLVYNIAAAGVIIWEEIIYSDSPETLETFDGDWRVSTNEEFSYFPNVDYIFEEGPEELMITSFDGQEIKGQLSFLDWTPMEVSDWLAVAVEEDAVEATLEYMEKQMSLGHDDIFFIENYFGYAESNEEADRAKKKAGENGWNQEPWISVAHDLENGEWGIGFDAIAENAFSLEGLDSIVVDQRNVRLVVNYPLNGTHRFDIQSLTGQFSLKELLQQTAKTYEHIYAEEEETSTIEILHYTDEPSGHRRNETNGTYGIWGFDLDDLFLSGFGQIRRGDTLYIIPWVYENS